MQKNAFFASLDDKKPDIEELLRGILKARELIIIEYCIKAKHYILIIQNITLLNFFEDCVM